MKSKVRKSKNKRKSLKRTNKKVNKKTTKRQNKILNHKNKNTRKNKKGGDATLPIVAAAAATAIAGGLAASYMRTNNNNTKPPPHTITKKYEWTNSTNKSTNNPTNKSTNNPTNKSTNNASSISGSQQINKNQIKEKEKLADMILFLQEKLEEPIIEGSSEGDPGMLDIIEKYKLNKNENDKLWKEIQQNIQVEEKITLEQLDEMIQKYINLSKVKSSE